MDTLTLPQPKTPDAVARHLLDAFFADDYKAPTLLYWRGDWWRYGGGRWFIWSELELEGELYDLLGDARFEVKDDRAGETTLQPWNPTAARVANVVHSLRARCNRLVSDLSEAPQWIRRDPDDRPANEYVAMANGMLHLPTRKLFPSAPDLFTTYTLDFAHDPKATCPVWEGFIDEVFAHDPKAGDLLAEYAGYIISGRTDLHKGLIVVGPRRAGKGTIIRILTLLLGGVANVATTTLHTLGSEFGNAGLIGKPLAVIPDARADDDRRGNQATEVLLNVIGEDAVAINRKNRPFWSGTLPTRFIIASNEVPRFLDASGAVVSRFMSMRLKQSFEGAEDLDLDKKLSRELPGIYLWALDGLARLERNGRFTEPETMAEMFAQMSAFAAPTTQFVTDIYEVTGDPVHHVPRSEVYREYRSWCLENGLKPVGLEVMCNRLQAGEPRLSTGHREAVPRVLTRSGSPKRERVLLGLRRLSRTNSGD